MAAHDDNASRQFAELLVAQKSSHRADYRADVLLIHPDEGDSWWLPGGYRGTSPNPPLTTRSSSLVSS
jgi:hypothetical protein